MIVIAVDGTAASGKGTVARKLAEHFALAHLDTGALYRLVALMVLRAGGDPANEEAAAKAAQTLDLELLASPDLRTTGTGQAASVVAAIPAVRAALVDYQRTFARTPPSLPDGRPAMGAVLDGRDIGTVICPDADVKIFCDAAPRTRAHRRFLELGGGAAPGALSEIQILADITERDERDRRRPSAPLKRAEDAYLLDSTNLSIEATFEAACDIVKSALEAKNKAMPRR